MSKHKDEAQEMIEDMGGLSPWHSVATQAIDKRDQALADKQRIIDDLAEALSMIASEETDDPARFAAQALGNNGLYTYTSAD